MIELINIPKASLELLKKDGSVDWLDAEHILSAVENGVILDGFSKIEDVLAHIKNLEEENKQLKENINNVKTKINEMIDNELTLVEDGAVEDPLSPEGHCYKEILDIFEECFNESK